MSRVILSLFVASIGLAYAGPAGGQTKSDRDVVAIGKQATALVEVVSPGPEGSGSGSAFCIDRSGLFITNAHVIGEAEGGRAELRLVLDTGRSSKRLILRAKVVRSDDRLDLALLKVDPVADLTPLSLGRDDGLNETMPVTTFGFPFGRTKTFHVNGYPDITVLESKISSLLKDEGKLEKIQFDNQLNPGNSGGPVLGKDGQVVGVAQATVKGAAMNFAIPVGQLRDFLQAPGIAFDPPALPYKDRAKPVTWTIKVQPATPRIALGRPLCLGEGRHRCHTAPDLWDQSHRPGHVPGHPDASAGRLGDAGRSAGPDRQDVAHDDRTRQGHPRRQGVVPVKRPSATQRQSTSDHVAQGRSRRRADRGPGQGEGARRTQG